MTIISGCLSFQFSHTTQFCHPAASRIETNSFYTTIPSDANTNYFYIKLKNTKPLSLRFSSHVKSAIYPCTGYFQYHFQFTCLHPWVLGSFQIKSQRASHCWTFSWAVSEHQLLMYPAGSTVSVPEALKKTGTHTPAVRAEHSTWWFLQMSPNSYTSPCYRWCMAKAERSSVSLA